MTPKQGTAESMGHTCTVVTTDTNNSNLADVVLGECKRKNYDAVFLVTIYLSI